MELDRNDITELVADIWSSMTGITVSPTAPTAPAGAGASLTGFVHINGDWQGTVALECPAQLAAAVAGAMFGMEPDEVGDEEIQDAWGEMTNMTGGAIKALLPGTSQLSLPTVVQGEGHRVTVPGTEEIADLHFATTDHTIAVRVLTPVDGALDAASPAAIQALA